MTTRKVDPFRLDLFCSAYLVNLEQAVKDYGDEYDYQVADCPTVVVKMRKAFDRGDYNHNGRAIRSTCRELGLKHTRKAIETYLSGI